MIIAPAAGWPPAIDLWPKARRDTPTERIQGLQPSIPARNPGLAAAQLDFDGAQPSQGATDRAFCLLSVAFQMLAPHYPAEVGPPIVIWDGGRSMETVIGIALIIIAALEIVWIIRIVSANTPYQA